MLRPLRVIVLIGALLVSITSAMPAQAAVRAVLRVDQLGFTPDEPKLAYVLASAPVRHARFVVRDHRGRTVLAGKVGATSRGSWNAGFPAVYPIDLSRLTHPGTYRIAVRGPVTATSPPFRVQPAAALYGRLVRDGLAFFRTQRDGTRVIPGALHRRPAHRNDRAATVYRIPTFVHEDVIADADLTRIGGPVDVQGGWYDAGDYLKFTHTTAYGAVTLLAAARAFGHRTPPGLPAEARFGVDWLMKMWDQRTRTLYLQVGIGSGNRAGTFTGDHDLWRLPQGDDADTDPANRYATAHRPVFPAAPPGQPISPNLAGRVAAAFALAAQADAHHHPRRARAELRAATTLYAQADVASPPDPLATALPTEFYPEDTWHDDMELAATEIALAAHRLGDRGGDRYLRDATRYAAGYLADETGDTFNLYDTSALAHADLLLALRRAGNPRGLAVTRQRLIADLQRQLRTGVRRAAADIFHAGAVYADFDANSHTFGLLATEAMYRTATGDTRYAGFATHQRNWVLGANAWGVSFMIGVGTTFPRCPQHAIGNLAGGRDGTRPLLRGAVVNGPNDTSLFADGLGDDQDGMVRCPSDDVDRYAAFTGHGSRYVDDVRAWQTGEPALDMTGSAILGAALQQAAAVRSVRGQAAAAIGAYGLFAGGSSNVPRW